MGGGYDFSPFPLTVKRRYVDDLLGLFHHYHHEYGSNRHAVHHCEHTDGLEIIHCGCKAISGSTQHAVNRGFLNCMLHIPNITGIPEMRLSLSEECPNNKGYYHIGTTATLVEKIIFPVKKVV